jgi:U3 small nucleolar RNA-associated protein 21
VKGRAPRVMATALFSPYKAVGHVTDGNPFCINRLGEETFMTVSIGSAFQV